MAIISHIEKDKLTDALLWIMGCLFTSFGVTYFVIHSYFERDYLDFDSIRISQPGITIYSTIFLCSVIYFIKGLIKRFANITENIFFICFASLFLILFIQITSAFYLLPIGPLPTEMPSDITSAESEVLKTVEFARRRMQLMGLWSFIVELIVLIGIIRVSIEVGKLLYNYNSNANQ